MRNVCEKKIRNESLRYRWTQRGRVGEENSLRQAFETVRRPHHRAPLRTTVLFHGALHPHGLFQSVLMGLDASYTGHEAKYPSVSRFEVFIAGLAILSSAHLSLLRTALRFNGKSRKTIGGIDANRFHSLCFPSISLLFFYYFFFFRLFGYSDRSFFLSRLYRAEAF